MTEKEKKVPQCRDCGVESTTSQCGKCHAKSMTEWMATQEKKLDLRPFKPEQEKPSVSQTTKKKNK